MNWVSSINDYSLTFPDFREFSTLHVLGQYTGMYYGDEGLETTQKVNKLDKYAREYENDQQNSDISTQKP